MSEPPAPAPTISVVMPTFNRRESLRVTLDALSRQSYPADRWEAVVVSDGSTDGTNDLLDEYAKEAPFRLRPITQANAGPSRARNRGIREATGDVVVFIDDDVEPVPDFLATHAAHHATDEKVIVIGPLSPDPARRAQEPVWIAWEHAMLEKQYEAFRTGQWPEAGPHHFYSGNGSVRRSHLNAVNGFDETFTRQEDVELAFRIQRECGVRFLVEMKALGVHRPLRTWESWLRVPYAYGGLDVVRARSGNAPWETVRHGYAARNRATRLLADSVLAIPGLSKGAQTALRTAATAAYRLGRDKAAFAALSAVYNTHYLEGARDEMGQGLLSKLIHANEAPVPVAAPTSVGPNG